MPSSQSEKAQILRIKKKAAAYTVAVLTDTAKLSLLDMIMSSHPGAVAEILSSLPDGHDAKATFEHHFSWFSAKQSLDARLLQSLRDRGRVTCVKLLRAETGKSLKDAVDYVKALCEKHQIDVRTHP